MTTSYPNVAFQGEINPGYVQQSAGAIPFEPEGNRVTFHNPETSVTSKSALGIPYHYAPLPPILRRTQIALYTFSFLQLLLSGIAVCVFVHGINDRNHNEATDIDILIIDAFLFGCSVVGLMAASGRSRVILGAFIATSLLVLAQSALLLNFMRKNCEEKSYSSSRPWKCEFGRSSSSYRSSDTSYTDARYTRMIANLAFNIIFTLGGSLSSAGMLVASVKTNDVRP
jgi:hypothetical protein